MSDRHASLALAHGFTARNRLVLPPMASGTATAAGLASAGTLAHYARLAGAGPALAFVEYTYVHESGQSEPNQLGLTSDAHAEALRPIAAALKATGAIAGLQLTHAGGKTERVYSGGALMAPSAIAVPVKDRELEVPTAMTRADLALWKQAFLTAAMRAVAVGFDLIELHAAHGYGLSQFLSAHTNARTDEYGGSLVNRARLVVEIIATLRAALPGTLLAVRLGADSLDDYAQAARLLEAAGADLIDVSSGVSGWRRPTDRSGEGYLVPEAAHVQAAVRIPVIGVGGIQSATFVDESLRSGLLSLAAVGRALSSDPEGFGARFAHGRKARGIGSGIP